MDIEIHLKPPKPNVQRILLDGVWYKRVHPMEHKQYPERNDIKAALKDLGVSVRKLARDLGIPYNSLIKSVDGFQVLTEKREVDIWDKIKEYREML